MRPLTGLEKYEIERAVDMLSRLKVFVVIGAELPGGVIYKGQNGEKGYVRDCIVVNADSPQRIRRNPKVGDRV